MLTAEADEDLMVMYQSGEVRAFEFGSEACGAKNPGVCSEDRRGASIASGIDMPNAARQR